MENKKISQLVSAGTLNGSELVEVVKNGANYKTTSQSVADLSKTYTVYTAKVTQSAMNAPTATVLENTTDETFTFTYESQGTYFLTKTGANFDTAKTFFSHSPNAAYWVVSSVTNNDNYIAIQTTPFDDIGYVSDNLLNGFIEVRIYN